jgi:hypothetical protein
MTDLKKLEFFLLKYVPNAVKQEFVNLGVVMLESDANGAGFADVRFTRDWRRVRCLDPQVDVEMLEELERDIRGQLGDTRDREVLLRKLGDSFSNLIQISATKACLTEQPAKEIEMLASLYCDELTGKAQSVLSERQGLRRNIGDAFEKAGVSAFLMTNVPAAEYTEIGDPLKFDFGYRVGDEIKLFHAVPLKASVEQAIMLASRYPKIAMGITKRAGAHSSLTAVIGDNPDRDRDEVRFALHAMKEGEIQVAVAAELPLIAERARLELR